MEIVIVTGFLIFAFWSLNAQFVAWDKPKEVEPAPADPNASVLVTYAPCDPLELIPVAHGYEVELAQQAGLLLAMTPGSKGAYLPAWFVETYVELAALSVPRQDVLNAVRQGEKATRALLERHIARLRGAERDTTLDNMTNEIASRKAKETP